MTYSFAELVAYARQAGFSGDAANRIAAISLAESGGDPNAINYNDPGGSYGLTQINGAAWGPSAQNTLGNPLEAFRQAFSISKGGTDFTPWSTYNSGAYLQFYQPDGGADSVPPAMAGLPDPTQVGAASFGSSDPGSLSGETATGQTTTVESPLSAIFGAIGNLFQQFGFIVLGGVLVAVGAWYLAKPKEGG